MTRRTLPQMLAWAVCCAGFFLTAPPSKGEIIRLQSPAGFMATAELLAGDKDKQAILIQHGFLQTRDFFTIRRLAESLHERGYTLLSPNLTLGIDNRRQSLACEAMHTHSMQQDLAEIGFWVDWLHRRSGKQVTLIGHSAGSLSLFAYLAQEASPPVNQAILISLLSFAEGPAAKENPAQQRQALQRAATDEEAIASYRLAFCDSYPTTAKNYLSYVEWNGIKTLKNLNKLTIKPTILLGGEDRRLGDDWLPALRQAGAEVILIPGANHFFDHEYEFDLLDVVVELLER